MADEVANANVDLTIKIFPSKSLFKPREQYKPLSAGQLDMSVFPLSYAGGLRGEYNLTLMPGLVKNHDHAARLNNSDFMKKIDSIMAEDDVRVVVHGYLAGGFVGKEKCITSPDDVKGQQTRAAGVFFYMLSSLFITQSIAAWIGTLDVNPWVLMFAINIFLLVAGFFLPPVAVILMAAPILLPIVINAGFDPYWFAVILTITPPVGLNLYVINGIAPKISLRTILIGSLPVVACMVIAILLLCLFPELATWLPDKIMGEAV